MEKLAGIHHGAPPAAATPARPSRSAAARERVEVNTAAPAFGKRKAVLYATCFVNYNNPDIGTAARAVLAKNGVETEVVYPACCGMPKLEQGDIERGRRGGAQGVGGAAALDRQGLRRRRADAVLRADAEVRMAADPARGSRRRAAVAGDVRHRRIRRRHRQEGRSGAGPGAARRRRHRASRLPCPRAEHGPEGGRDAAADPRDAGRGDRALLRPWRHLGRAHREFRDGGEGRQAGRAGGAEGRHQLRRLRMPAGGRSPDAGDGNAAGDEKPKPVARRPSDRASRHAPTD